MLQKGLRSGLHSQVSLSAFSKRSGACTAVDPWRKAFLQGLRMATDAAPPGRVRTGEKQLPKAHVPQRQRPPCCFSPRPPLAQVRLAMLADDIVRERPQQRHDDDGQKRNARSDNVKSE